MLLVKSFLGFCERTPRRQLFRFFLLAYHIELTMIVLKSSSSSVNTGPVPTCTIPRLPVDGDSFRRQRFQV
jgi:hypothetical protein